MLATDPRSMSAALWTAQTGMALAPYGTIPRLTNEARWPEWASLVVALPAIAATGAPRPQGFASWRAWALQFNVAVQGLPV